MGLLMRNPIFVKNVEPSVEELLADPIAHLLMARDGLQTADVLAVVDQARKTLHQRRFASDSIAQAAA